MTRLREAIVDWLIFRSSVAYRLHRAWCWRQADRRIARYRRGEAEQRARREAEARAAVEAALDHLEDDRIWAYPS